MRSGFRLLVRLFLPLALAASHARAAQPAAAPLAGSSFPNLAYATLGGRPIALDLYLPPAPAKPAPLVIYIHGGGWAAGNRTNMPGFMLKFLDLGFAVASVDYRLTTQAGQWSREPVTFPAQIFDVKGAVRFLRANAAKYHLDPDRFAAMGDSAGGHLVALLATSGGVAELEGAVGGNAGVSSRVQAGVDYYGPTDMLHLADDVTSITGATARRLTADNPVAMLIGCQPPPGEAIDIRAHLTDSAAPYGEICRLLTLANPVAFVDPRDPPLFIGHATGDSLVPVGQSQRLAAALKKAGVKCELMITQGGGHGSLSVETHIAALRFLCDTINPEGGARLAVLLQLMNLKQ